MGLLLTDSGTALSGPSIFIFVSHSIATLASRFLKRGEVCDLTDSQSRSEATTSQTTFTSEKRSVTTGTDADTPSHHTPMLTIIHRQFHHFLLQIHTHHSHPLLLSLKPSPLPFCSPCLWLPCSCFVLFCWALRHWRRGNVALITDYQCQTVCTLGATSAAQKSGEKHTFGQKDNTCRLGALRPPSD